MSERVTSKNVSFTEVCDVIQVERAYQDAYINPNVMSVGDELTLLRAYLRDAENAFKEGFGDDHEALAMDVVRKIAGTCVRAMQNHGAVPRALKESFKRHKTYCGGVRIICTECGNGIGKVIE